MNSQPHSAYQWSPDRIDPSKGYIIGNVRVVALELNSSPTYTHEVLKEYVYRSEHDVPRDESDLESISKSKVFIKAAKLLLKYTSKRAANWSSK